MLIVFLAVIALEAIKIDTNQRRSYDKRRSVNGANKMKPNPRDYDTPDAWDDAMQAYICYMETMYDRIDMEIERQKEDERIENEDKTE